MNKNFKILSSLAAAGIITVTGLTSAVSAATPNSLGVYRKVISGTIAPYIVATANDKVTVQDLKNDHGNITISLSNNEKVATGTTFRKNGESHTVIIYGDVDGNGDINVNDVTTLAQGVVKGNLTEVKKEAGNVEHNNSTDVNDVTKLARFIVKGEKITVSLPSEEIPATEYAYELTVNDNNVINNVNLAKTKIVVTPKTAFKANDSFTLSIDKKGEDGKYTNKSVTMIAAVAGENAANEIKAQVSDKYREVEADLSGLATGLTAAQDIIEGKIDGIYRMQIKQTGKVVGEAEVEIHAATKDVKVNTIVRRMGEDRVMLSAEGYGKETIQKIYALIDASSPTNTKYTTPATAAENIVKDATNIYTLSNNVLGEQLIVKNNMGTASKSLYYVVEDSYGSRVSAEVPFAEDYSGNLETNYVKSIVASKVANQFTITLNAAPASGRRVIAMLYKNGKAVDRQVVSITGTTGTVTIPSTVEEEATYTVKAYLDTLVSSANATDDKNPSAIANTEEKQAIKLIQLDKVTNIRYDKENEAIVWSDNSEKNEGAGYTVTYLAPKSDGTYDVAQKATVTNVDAENKTATDNNLKFITNKATIGNKAYKVTVTANPASDNVRGIASEPVEQEIYVLNANALGISTATADMDKNDTTVTFKNLTPIELLGNDDAEVTYDVEVYQHTRSSENSEYRSDLVETRRNVPIVTERVNGVDKHKMVLSNLTQGARYSFVVIAKVGNETDKATETAQIQIAKKDETIDNLKVVKTGISSEKDVKQDEIYYTSGNYAYIKGTKIDLREYTPEFTNLFADVIAQLEENDRITVSGNTITVKVGTASATTTFGNNGTLKGKTLILQGNASYRTIVTPAKANQNDDSNTAAEIRLEPTDGVGYFMTNWAAVDSSLNAEKVTLNGVILTTDTRATGTPAKTYDATKYTLKAGKVNTINGVDVEASIDTVIKAEANTIDVTPSNSKLTFDNKIKGNLTINFDGDLSHEPKQDGNITIISESGNITVSSTNAAITGMIDVQKVENGILDLTADTLTGTQKVKVTNKADATANTPDEKTTVKAKLAKALSVNIDSTTLAASATELTLENYSYSNKDEEDTVKATLASKFKTTTDEAGKTVSILKEEELNEIFNFVKGLNISADCKATVKVTGKTIELVFNSTKGTGTKATEGVTNYTVQGLQTR